MLEETSSIYQIFVRNFSQDGSLLAIIPELERIRSMGFEWIYLTPLHPIGEVARKGTLGSPYAIKNYREINPELGTLTTFRRLVQTAHDLGLKVMIDVVYNHTSPDSFLSKDHPEWFLRDKNNAFTRKFEEWSDVIDLDFASSPALWDELIDTLIQWREEGVNGFRCDVASLVPLDFWKEARRRVNAPDTSGKDCYSILWLAEQVHPQFLLHVRKKGFACHGGPELHQVFDLTYDYDGFERLEGYWGGEKSLDMFIEYLYTQQTVYPAGITKARFLENHDQKRAAWRFPQEELLKQWTVFYQLLPGITFAYMGQEYACDVTPSLFEKDHLFWERKKSSFAQFFTHCFSITQRIKALCPGFSIRRVGEGLVWIEREGEKRYGAFLNLEGKRGDFSLPFSIEGVDCFTGKTVSLEGRVSLPSSPLIVELPKNR